MRTQSQESKPISGVVVPSPRSGGQVERNGPEPHGMRPRGMGHDGMGHDGTGHDGTGHDGTGHNGTAAGRPVPAARGLGAPVPRAPEPSWGTVIANTLRLWAERRQPRIRRLWPRRARWRVVAVAGLLALVFGAGAVTVALSGSRGTDSHAARRASGASAAGAALAATAAARQQAAAWIAGQVSADAIVACDPAMCGALQAQHLPAGRLLVLGPGQADPLGSDLVVATPVVRNQFGARLASVYAPVTLAAFGAGSVRIDVRAVAPDGAAAYQAALAADVRARQAAGGQLLHNRHIRLRAGARAALAGGEVDSRLLVTLAALAALHPVDILGFGGAGHGASAGVPLRVADIAVASVPGAHRQASLHSLRAFLGAQRPPYLPASVTTVRITSRRAGLEIEYGLPSPLGLLGSRR
jgi:hypothetical protein